MEDAWVEELPPRFGFSHLVWKREITSGQKSYLDSEGSKFILESPLGTGGKPINWTIQCFKCISLICNYACHG